MILADLLGLGVGLVSLALFAAQRRQVEYFWIFLQGAAGAAQLSWKIVTAVHDLPVGWCGIDGLLDFMQNVAMMFMVEAFLRKRFGRLFWLGGVFAFFLGDAAAVAAVHGNVASPLLRLAEVPGWIVWAILFPLLVFRELRRCNRETGILLIPLILWSVEVYIGVGGFLLDQIPGLHTASGILISFINDAIDFGVISISLPSLCTFSFWIAMAIIMVFRSTRTSRQEALLEGQIAAAREVQQVIVPEKIEAVPRLCD